MATTPAARRNVPLRPAPPYDPPYDDQRAPEPWPSGAAVQPLLDLTAPGAAEPGTGAPARSSPARQPASPAAWPSRPAASPLTAAAAARFVNTCLEILNGYRPVTHFRVLASPLDASDVLAAMTHAFRRLRRGGHRVTGPDRLLAVRTMRTCEPRPGVAEIAVVIGVGQGRPRAARRPGQASADDQAWALVYRLERQRGQWLCTVAHML